MRKVFYIVISVVVIYAFTNIYNQHVMNEADDIKKIESIANSYYSYLLNKNYSKALELIDYGGSDYYDDLEWLNNNKEYSISKVENRYNFILQVEYEHELEMYTAVSIITVSYKEKKSDYNEELHFVKKGESYYIYSIGSRDEYVNYRSNRNQGM